MADNRFSRELPRNHVCGSLAFGASTTEAAIAGLIAEIRRVGLVRFHRSPEHGIVMAIMDLVLPPEAMSKIDPPSQKKEEARPTLTSADGFDWGALQSLLKRSNPCC